MLKTATLVRSIDNWLSSHVASYYIIRTRYILTQSYVDLSWPKPRVENWPTRSVVNWPTPGVASWPALLKRVANWLTKN